MLIVRAAAVAAVLAVATSAWCNSDDYRKPLEQAATEVSYLSFDKALPLFASVAGDAEKGSEPWQQAVFGQAVCLQQIAPVTEGRLAEASRLYRELAENHSSGKYAVQSMMALGRIAELVDYLGDQPDRPAARQWYEKARASAGANSDLSHEATFRIAGSFIQTFDAVQAKQGVEILETWLAQHPRNPLASAMWQYAADTLFWPLGEEKRAIAAYIKADEIGLLEVGREGPIYWRIANLAERNNERATAVAYYTKIILKTPTSGKAYESQLALRRLGEPVPPIRLFEASAGQSSKGAQ